MLDSAVERNKFRSNTGAESCTLIQTHKKIQEFPLVLMGKGYWQPLLDFLHKQLIAAGTIDAADADRFFVTDSAEEAVQAIKERALRQFGLTYGPRIKRRWFLG